MFLYLCLPATANCACLPYAFHIASFPGHRPASHRTASDGKLGEGLGTRLLLTAERQRRMDCYNKLCASPLTLLKVDQKVKFVPRGMSAQFIDEVQCDPQVVESICEGKAQLLFISPESLLLVCAAP